MADLSLALTVSTKQSGSGLRTTRQQLVDVGAAAVTADKGLASFGDTMGHLARAAAAPLGALGRLAGAVDVLGKIGLAAGGISALTGAAAGLGRALVGPVQEASALGEQLSRTGVVFGSQAGAMEDWSKTAAQAFGLSQTAALQAAGDIGAMTTAMGLATPQAAKMSRSVVELAGDLASFADATPEDALAALRSGLVGEAEPLRRFGVLLDEAATKAKAVQLGLYSGKGDLSESAALQARYALILEQTTRAQGDFARTSGSLANAQRIIKASFADIRAELGNNLLPHVARLASAFSRALPDAVHAARAVVAAFLIDARALEHLMGAIRRVFGDTAANAIAPFVDRFVDAVPRIKAFAGEVGQALGRVAGIVGQALGGDTAGAFEAFKVLLKDTGDALKPLLAAWTEAFASWVKEMAPRVLKALGEFATGVLDLIVVWAPLLTEKFLGEWLPAVLKWIPEAAKALGPRLSALLLALDHWMDTEGGPRMEALGDAMGQALVRGFVRGASTLREAIGAAIGDYVREQLRLLGLFPQAVAGATGVGFVPRLPSGAGGGSGFGGTVNVDVEVNPGAVTDRESAETAAREVGDRVTQRVLDALLGSAQSTDPGADPRLPGAGR